MVLEQLAISNITSLLTGFITWIIVLGVFLIVGGIITYFIVFKKIFFIKIKIYEKINNQYEETKSDRAREIKLGRDGTLSIYLARNRKHLPYPQIQSGRNTYMYVIREDGEWINIGIEDIDYNMRNLQARFLDKEIRHARTHLQGNLKERYSAPKFLERYGGIIAYTLLILMFGIIIYLWWDKMIALNNSVNLGTLETLKTLQQLAETLNQILASMENVCSSSGLKPANLWRALWV